jgi:Flp pilus assembly protein TadG
MTMDDDSAEISPKQSRDGERGVYVTWFIFLLPLLLAAIGLAVDMAHYRMAHAQLQNAADSAALAGAKSIDGQAAGRTAAATVGSTYAKSYTIDGQHLAESDVLAAETGKFGLSDGTFTTSGVNDIGANAIRVSLQRRDVTSFFSPILSGTLESRSFTATATAVAGGAGAVECGAPLTVGACALQYDSSGNLICPDKLSFQNGTTSVGITIPDGSSPANGNKARPYFKAAVTEPLTCDQRVEVGSELYLQNGDDLSRTSVNDINDATNDGANPVPIIVPITDVPCGGNGTATYNGTAPVVGFIKLTIVGARWTSAAPEAVAAACPDIGKKNICVTKNCSMIAGTPGGGTVQVDPSRVYLVR